MQGRENTSGDLMALRSVFDRVSSCLFLRVRRLSLQQLMNPPGSGYRSETGGLMKALRVLAPEQSNHSSSCALLRSN